MGRQQSRGSSLSHSHRNRLLPFEICPRPFLDLILVAEILCPDECRVTGGTQIANLDPTTVFSLSQHLCYGAIRGSDLVSPVLVPTDPLAYTPGPHPTQRASSAARRRRQLSHSARRCTYCSRCRESQVVRVRATRSPRNSGPMFRRLQHGRWGLHLQAPVGPPAGQPPGKARQRTVNSEVGEPVTPAA